MIKLNIHEAKTNLSRYLKYLAEGKIIILCKRNTPIAEIRPLKAKNHDLRPIGLARQEYGEFEIGPEFFEPLPEDVLAGFDGG